MTDIREYHEARATRIMRGLPRFGHTKKFSYITGSKDQQQDYIYGLLFAGVFIIAFFLAWTVIVAILKCLGQQKVGFVSGKSFKVPADSKRPRRVRVSFILSAIMLVIFAILLVTKGLTQLKTGVGDIYTSAVEWNRLTTEAQWFVSDLIELTQASASGLREDVYKTVAQAVCDEVNLDEEAQNMTAALAQLGNFSMEELLDVEEALAEMNEMSENMAETADNITLGSWQSLIFIIPFPIFSSLFVCGVLLAWFGRFHRGYARFLTWGVLPLFFILIVICYLLSGAVAIAASANADFCSGGTEKTPQETILEIVILNGASKEDMAYRIINLYLTSCTESGGNPLRFLGEYQSQLLKADSTISQFKQAAANNTAQEYIEVCGEENYAALQNVTNSMHGLVIDLSNLTSRAADLLACDRILPILTSAMWDGACQYSVQGVTWAFSAFFVVAMMGMLMITFRSSWLPTEICDGKQQSTALVDCGKGQEDADCESYLQGQAVEKPVEDKGGDGDSVLMSGVPVGESVVAESKLGQEEAFATSVTTDTQTDDAALNKAAVGVGDNENELDLLKE